MYSAAKVEGLASDSYLSSPSGLFWLVQLRNDSPRPVREIACRLPAEYEEAAVKTAWFNLAALDKGFALADNKVIPVLLSGSTEGFVIAIPTEAPQLLCPCVIRR